MDGQGLYELVNNLGFYIKDHKDLIYTLVILIASIYIPLFIINIELLKKENNKLDLALFFEKKVNIKILIFLYLFIFIILFFWNTGNNLFYHINILLVLILITPILELINKLVNLNNYFLVDTKTINEERLKFLEKVNFKNIEIWLDSFKLDLLKDYNFSRKYTKILFNGIIKETKKIISKKKEKERYILVENIRSLLIAYNELKYDSIFYSFFDENNLDLFFNINKEIYEQRKSKNYIWISNNLSDILKNNLEKLKNDEYYIFVFYKILKKHIEENKKDLEYIRELLGKILNIYFNSDILLQEDNILIEFPYKINLSLLKNTNTKEYEKVLYLLVLRKTLDYIRDDIVKHYLDKKIKFNNKINNILEYWFGEFEDIITFSDILYMLFVPYGKNRAKSILKGNRTFGYVSRGKFYSGYMSNEDFSKNYIDEYENTISKFKKFLPGLINKDKLEKLLKEFEEIIKENKMEEKYILRAKNYKKLLKYLLK